MLLSSRLVSYTASLRTASAVQQNLFKKPHNQKILKTPTSDAVTSPKIFGLIAKFHDFTDEENEDRVHTALMLTIESSNKHMPAHDSCISIFLS